LKKFFVIVGYLQPNLIPNEKIIWVPLPFDSQHPQPGFHYREVIAILEVVVIDLAPQPPPTGSEFVPTVGAVDGVHQPPDGAAGASLSWPSRGVSPLHSSEWACALGRWSLGGAGASTLCPPVWLSCRCACASSTSMFLPGMGATRNSRHDKLPHPPAGPPSGRRHCFSFSWFVAGGTGASSQL
jgi:hypothetical protein